MTNKNDTVLDFEGKDFFVGIDTSKKNWKIAVRCDDFELKRESINPDPYVLAQYLNKRYPGGKYHTVYESGYCGFWIHREFQSLGINSMVVSAGDVPTSHKEKDRKDDPVDARKLARELEKNNLVPIYIPTKDEQHIRSLGRHLGKVVQSMTRTKNRIKAFLAFNGIVAEDPEKSWTKAYIVWLKSLEVDNGPGLQSLHYYLEELEEHKQRRSRLMKSLRTYFQENGQGPLVERLCSVPGIGFQTAMVLITEIMDMKRFATFDKLKTFVGLIPSKDSSGERDISKGVTKRRNRHIRYVLIEAAWVVARQDPTMFKYYSNLLRHMKSQDAIIRVAKKLLRRIRHIWLNPEETYKCSLV